jgi:hypothetical protein
MSALTIRVMARLSARWAMAECSAVSCTTPVRLCRTSLCCSSRIRSISAISSRVARPAARPAMRARAAAAPRTAIHEPAASIVRAAPHPAKIEARPFAVYGMS